MVDMVLDAVRRGGRGWIAVLLGAPLAPAAAHTGAEPVLALRRGGTARRR